MEQRKLNTGDVIFREGEESEEAYRVMTGKVQISIKTKSGPRVLSQLYPGEIFGEMGMVDDQPRSATAIASKPTIVEVITIDKFIEYIMSDEKRLSDYLGTVFERLRVSDLKLQMALSKGAEPEYIGANDYSLDELFYGSPGRHANEEQNLPPRTVKIALKASNGPPIEMTVEKFPFRIGRLDALGDNSPFGKNDLGVPDEKPYEVSRNHCSIEEQSGRYFLRDRGSTLGTVVNGTSLGAKSQVFTEELQPGENTVKLGRKDSTCVFSVTVS